MKKNMNNYRPSLLGSIQIITILLKLFGVVNIPWWLVFTPTYFAILSIAVLMTLIALNDKKEVKHERLLKEEVKVKEEKELTLSKSITKTEKQQLQELRNMYVKDNEEEKNKIKALTR